MAVNDFDSLLKRQKKNNPAPVTMHGDSKQHWPAAHNDKDERVTPTMDNAFAVTKAQSLCEHLICFPPWYYTPAPKPSFIFCATFFFFVGWFFPLLCSDKRLLSWYHFLPLHIRLTLSHSSSWLGLWSVPRKATTPRCSTGRESQCGGTGCLASVLWSGSPVEVCMDPQMWKTERQTLY